METYTKHGKEADKCIQAYLDAAAKDIVKAIPDVISIILMGGYGRGEGAVLRRGKRYMPVNDFDMYIVTKKLLPDKFLEDLATEISKKFGWGGKAHAEAFETANYEFKKFLHIDIRCLEESKLHYLPPTVRYFEMKYAGKVIYGKNTLLDFPEIKENEIPISEGLRLVMNRYMLMLISFKQDYIMDRKAISDEEKKILYYYIGKAYFTACENLLILAGKFKATYWERAYEMKKIYKKEFPETARKHPGLVEKIFFYLNYKKDMKPIKGDYVKEWFEARDTLGEIAKMALSKLLNKNIENKDWIETYRIMKNNLEMPYFEPYARFFLKKYHLNNFVLRWLLSRSAMAFFSYKYSLRMNENYKTSKLRYLRLHDPGVKILAMTFLVMFSIDENCNINKDMLAILNKDLKDVYISEYLNDWAAAKNNYLFAQRTYFLMRFV